MMLSPLGPFPKPTKPKRVQDNDGDAHFPEAAVLQVFLEEGRGWLLLLSSMGEEEDNDDEPILFLRGLEGEELLGRGELRLL